MSSSFKIINASAGSGKTFSLVQNILKELFNGGDDSYKKILALTFTNNAANEMKKRILDELMLISEDYKSSKIFSLLKKELNISSSEAKVKAKRISNRILHNFSFFQVSTIDKFNHRIIRAFSQDLALSSDFDLIIDQDEFKEQFACDALVNTEVVSLKVIALSELPAIVATVPEKLPAIVPSEPAAVEKLGAVDAVIILFVDLPALPSGFSTLT